MATDNFGRPVEGISANDLAQQMSQPVKQAGADEIVAQLNALAQGQAALGKKIEGAIRNAVSGNDAIAEKLDHLEQAIQSNIAAAQALNQQIKASKSKSSSQPLTEAGLENVMKRHSQASPELKSLHDTITSKNTVYVKEKELRSLTRHLIKAVESLAAAIDPTLRTKGAKESVGSATANPESPESPAPAAGGGGSGGKKPPFSSSGIPNEPGGPTPGGVPPGSDPGKKTPFSSMGIPDEATDKAADNIGAKGKRAKKDWRDVRTNNTILLGLAAKFFDIEKSRYRISGENIEHHAFFQNQMKKHLFDENRGLKVSEQELQKIVELEGKRVGLHNYFTKQQTAELVRLRRQVALSGDDDAKRAKAIKEYHTYMEKVTNEAEKQQNKLSSSWETIKGYGREAAATSERLHEMGYGFTVSEAISRDILKNAREWVKESGEIAYYQQGIASDIRQQDSLMVSLNRNLSNNFVTNEARIRTGKSLATLQMQQIKNQKKGLKDAGLANRLAEKGVYLSTLLGSETGQTAENVRSWHMEMGLSEKSIVRLSSGIKGVANTMGLAGDEMLKVVDSTKQAMTNMRDLGTLTSTAASELIKLNAAGQKFGVGGKTQEMSEFLTGGITKVGDSRLTPGMINALQMGARKEGLSGGAAADLQKQMLFGELPNNREGMKVLQSGFKELSKAITGGKDVSKMSVEERGRANVVAQAHGFAGIGEIQQMLKAMDESNMSYTDRLKKLQDDRKKLDESQLSGLEKAQLNIRESSLTFAETSTLLGELNEGKKLSKSDLSSFGLSEAASKEQQQKVLAQKMFEASEKTRKEAISAGASQVSLGPGLTAEDLKQVQSGGMSMDEFLAKSGEANQRLEVEMHSLNNPIKRQTDLLEDINNFLQKDIGGLIFWLTHNKLFQTSSAALGVGAKYFDVQNSFKGLLPKIASGAYALRNLMGGDAAAVPVRKVGGAAAGGAGAAAGGGQKFSMKTPPTPSVPIKPSIADGPMMASKEKEQANVVAQSRGFTGGNEMQKPAVAQSRGFVGGNEMQKTVASATPILNSVPMEQKIKQDQVERQPDKKEVAIAGDIGGVKENTGETVEQLKVLVEQMKTMVTMMNVGGASQSPRLNTATNSRRNVIFDYHQWQLGGPESTPSRGPVTPDGLV